MHILRPYYEFFDEPMQERHTWHQNWFIWLAQFTARPVMWLYWRWKVRGKENIPSTDEEPVLFIANHLSFIDPPMLWLIAYPRIIRFLARTSLFSHFFIRTAIARIGGIPIEPDTADRGAIKRAVTCLKRGECVGIFPEGTRMNSPDKEYNPHAGAILIAQMAKVKIVPIGIKNADKIVPYGKHFPRPVKLYVKFGKAVDLKDFDGLPRKERNRVATEYIMERAFELRDCADEDYTPEPPDPAKVVAEAQAELAAVEKAEAEMPAKAKATDTAETAEQPDTPDTSEQ